MADSRDDIWGLVDPVSRSASSDPGRTLNDRSAETEWVSTYSRGVLRHCSGLASFMSIVVDCLHDLIQGIETNVYVTRRRLTCLSQSRWPLSSTSRDGFSRFYHQITCLFPLKGLLFRIAHASAALTLALWASRTATTSTESSGEPVGDVQNSHSSGGRRTSGIVASVLSSW